MNRIWKFPFEISDEEQPFVWYANPARDTVVAMQEDKLCLWQTVSHEKHYRYIGKVVGTGHLFDETWEHVGTGFDPRGSVWHLLIRPA